MLSLEDFFFFSLFNAHQFSPRQCNLKWGVSMSVKVWEDSGGKPHCK